MKFYLIQKKKDVEAIATFNPTDKSFTVLKGSKVSTTINQSATFKGARSIEKQRANGVVVNGIVTQNVPFKSSSTAANFVTGASSNGLILWKDKSGRSLKEILSETTNNE